MRHQQMGQGKYGTTAGQHGNGVAYDSDRKGEVQPHLGEAERAGDLETLRAGDLLPSRMGLGDLEADLEADLHKA